jgi:polyhydroxyalkanoate synthesis regulator phasin
MSTSKRTIAVAVAALAVAGGGGAAIAASQGSSAAPGAFFDSLAEHLGISTEELEDAAKAAATDQVDAALEEGRITQEEAERLRERIQQGDAPFLFGLPLFGGPHHHHGGAVRAMKFEAAAEYLGLTNAELGERLEDGQSLAEIARAEDKSVDGLKQALLDDATTRLDQAVEDGELTRERANEMLERLRERIDDFVERGFEGPRPGHFGPRPDRIFIPGGHA